MRNPLTLGAFRVILFRQLERLRNAPVAQLDRVFGYEPKGRGFESLPAYQFKPFFLTKERFFLNFFGVFILLG